MSKFQTVDYVLDQHVAYIYLNRPNVLNAVVPQLVEDLNQALDLAERDRVKVAVLSGRGRAFCSGHDLKSDENNFKNEDDEIEKRIRFQHMQDVTRKIRNAAFPIIASVKGYALGAGCEFALCCDLIIAEEDAKFGFPEVSVGLSVTGGISHILPMNTGLAKSKELLFLGEKFSAKEARNLGLINFVVEPGELENATHDLAKRLESLHHNALVRAKFALNHGSQSTIESAIETEIEHVVSTFMNKKEQSEIRN